MKLNLGCSDRHIEGYVSVDILPHPGPLGRGETAIYQSVDLNQWNWPWLDSSVDEILALDIFEHLTDRIHSINEAWRVLRDGGRLTLECPNAAKGSGQWQDPQHISAWCPNSLQYYEAGAPAREGFGEAYGIVARFRVLSVTERSYTERGEVWKFRAVLEAVK